MLTFKKFLTVTALVTIPAAVCYAVAGPFAATLSVVATVWLLS